MARVIAPACRHCERVLPWPVLGVLTVTPVCQEGQTAPDHFLNLELSRAEAGGSLCSWTMQGPGLAGLGQRRRHILGQAELASLCHLLGSFPLRLCCVGRGSLKTLQLQALLSLPGVTGECWV